MTSQHGTQSATLKAKIKVHAAGCYYCGSFINMNLPLGWQRVKETNL